MKTTSLFVELIIIGIGTAVWMVLLLDQFGVSLYMGLLTFKEFNVLLTAVVLVLVYILGIVTDRWADFILGFFSRKIRGKIYGAEAGMIDMERKSDQILEDKVLIYKEASPLVNMIDYGRSRLRICRGWIINSVMIILLGNWTLWQQGGGPLFWAFNGFMFLLLIGFIFAWRNLAYKEYHKIQRISYILRQNHKEKTSDNSR